MRVGFMLSALLTIPAVSWAQAPCTTDANSVVEAAYTQVLERPAGRDAAAAGTTSELASGRVTVRELMRTLAKSSEHRQRFLGTSNGPNGRDAAVTNLYRHLLGRQPDPDGLRAQASAFTNGNPDPIIDSLIDSPEYRMGFGEDTVPGSRLRFCGRQTDTRGGTQRDDSRADARGGNQGNQRGDARDNNQGDNRPDPRNNNQGDNRGGDPRNTQGDNRGDPRNNNQGDNRDARNDNRGGDPRFDPRNDNRGDPRDFGGAPGPVRFQDMDRNRNSVIERGEWSGTRATFDARDWNRDGVLSGDELRIGSRRYSRPGADEDFVPGRAPLWTANTFWRMDRNRDNRLTVNEWFYDAEFFRRADRNRDGTLTVDEFSGPSWDDDRDVRFDDLDVNRNGRVERNEWQGSLDAFRWLDRNGDNALSRVEVLGDTDSRFDSFAGLDVNRSGTVSLEEWPWSRRSFDQFDVNRDGQLTRREFSAGGAGSPTFNR